MTENSAGPSSGSKVTVPSERRWRWVISLGAIVLALLSGAILIIATSERVISTTAYFFARPGDFFKAAGETISAAYGALLAGAIFDPTAASAIEALRPLTDTIAWATPLIIAGLGMAISFRAGLFNIGAQGQIIVAAVAAGWVGFAVELPPVIHLFAALGAGMLAGAVWGGIPGMLKARTGAHEVITTIMFNWIAVFVLAFLLSLPSFQRPGSNAPLSPVVLDTASLPTLFGGGTRATWGFVIAVLCAVVVAWFFNRSTLGFKFEMVGLNPSAARTAGVNTSAVYFLSMVGSGAIIGLSGAVLLLGGDRFIQNGVAGSVGVDAIMVSLLGRSRPLGMVLAALLFGALRAGGVNMQAVTGTQVDIILVIQTLIVLFICAPTLVRAVFRMDQIERLVGARSAQKASAK